MSEPACPCDEVVHPRVISNPPGREVLDYRVADYASFRDALLRPRPGEQALAGWHPVAGDDLALQLLEWWAYLADILTFYNERAMHEVLVRTAVFRDDVRRIVRLLGYRPRPGIGATGVVAALTDATDPFRLPHGFAVEGAPPPGTPPQIFELDDDVDVGRLGQRLPRSARFPDLPGRDESWVGRPSKAPRGRLLDAVPAEPAKPTSTPSGGGEKTDPGDPIEVAFDGVVASVKPGDLILFLPDDWSGWFADLRYVVGQVKAVRPMFGVDQTVTVVTVIGASLLRGIPRRGYRVLRATKQAHLWLYHHRYPGSANPALYGSGIGIRIIERIFDPLGLFVGGGPPPGPPTDPRVLTGFSAFSFPPRGIAHLDAVTRGINPGDPVLFEKRVSGGIAGLVKLVAERAISRAALEVVRPYIMQLAQVNGYTEEIWYADAPEMERVCEGPPVGPASKALLESGGGGPIPIPHTKLSFNTNPFLDLMALGDLDIDKIVVHFGWEEVGKQVVPPPPSSTKKVEEPTTTVDVPPPPEVPPGIPLPVLVEDSTGIKGTPGWLGMAGGTSDEELVPPLRALLNLLPVSRGETVAREVLGSGDPLQIRQEFALRRFPLTYLADNGPHATDGYRSTLRVRVDGIEWTEVASFLDQAPDARVFVTREDDEQRTHVRFGDGVYGARLPAGNGNVVARYRVGSGATLPRPGSLKTIPRPVAGLREIRNPVPPGGGADPDPPDRIRRLAPRSVLTFERAISADDYETLAAQTPSVQRARVYWTWDATAQRAQVKVYVGDTPGAVVAARRALRACGDPNRPVEVVEALPIYPDLTMTLEIDPAYDPPTVEVAVVAALCHPRSRPFGTEIIRIGDLVYDSQIIEACMGVAGVAAVHDLAFARWTTVTIVPVVGPSTPPPADAAIQALFKQTFDAANPVSWNNFAIDMFDPLILGRRLGLAEGEISDPYKMAAKSKLPAIPVDSAPPPASTVRDVFTPDPGPRHVPGEGRFFLLREERIHLRSEVARHGL